MLTCGSTGEKPRCIGVDGVLVSGVGELFPEQFGEGFGDLRGVGAEGDAHSFGSGDEAVSTEHDDLVQGVGPEQEDESGDAGGRDDVAVLEAVPNELDTLGLGDHGRGLGLAKRHIKCAVGVSLLVIEPSGEVADVFARTGAVAEVVVDVVLAHLACRYVMMFVQPDQEFPGLGDLLLRGVDDGLEVGAGVCGFGADAFEVLPSCVAFDELAGAVVGKVGDSGGKPLFETHESLVAAGGHHAVVGEQGTQVVDGSGVRELVKGVVGQWKFAFTDRLQEGSGLGSAHVGVDALWPFAAGEQADEAVEPEVVARLENLLEVVVQGATDAEAGAKPFGFAVAAGAGQGGGDAGAVTAYGLIVGGAAGEHAVLGAVWAGAVSVGGFGEAASADSSVGPVEADLGDLLVAAVASVVPGRAGAATFVLLA